MSRRRRVISSSSSEDDHDNNLRPSPRQHTNLVQHNLQENFESVTLNPNPDDNDEEFTDALMDDFQPSDCPIGPFLANLGLRLKHDWVADCLRALEGSVPGFGGLDVGSKAKMCFERFLFSDLNFSGGGVLPGNVHGFHLVDLAGPFVLQVDEIVNMSCPLKGRYQAANPGLKRCLKLSMTDGVQRVFGMEYRPIKDLEVLAPAGLKIVIRNVHVRRGILMLVPEVVEILGGQVEDLEAARQRLVQEVNKPPRGKRTRNGVVPPLATRATHAAWPPNGLSGSEPTNVTTSQSAAPPRVAEPVSTPSPFTRERNTQEFSVPDYTLNLQPNLSSPVGNRRAHLEPNRSTGVENSMDLQPNISPPVGYKRANLEPNLSTSAENSRGSFDSYLSSTTGNRRASVESNLSSTAGNSKTNFASHIPSTPGNTMGSVETNLSSSAGNSWANVEPKLSYTVIPDVVEVHMTHAVDQPSILGGDTEMPFTYIASLSTKLATVRDKASYVQGTIKCFLTGVKGFQFRQREKFELHAYVDDGSLISEILIDHNFVQKLLGHSPQEVSAALSSPDTKRVDEIKETLRQFQKFLESFEGTMLVRISEASLPTAMEMNQGCSTPDAWLLLRRLKSYNANQPQQHPSVEPIDLSP